MQVWHLWMMAAIGLMALELFGAHFVLLGLGLAALVVALIMLLAPGLGLGVQVGLFTLAALLIVPGMVWLFRCFFPSGGVSVINEPGGRSALPRPVIERGGRAGVEIYGDFYPARFAHSGLVPEPGMEVVVTGFQGIVAQVRLAGSDAQGVSGI